MQLLYPLDSASFRIIAYQLQQPVQMATWTNARAAPVAARTSAMELSVLPVCVSRGDRLRFDIASAANTIAGTPNRQQHRVAQIPSAI